MNQKLIKFGIIIGLAPIGVLLFTGGLNILFLVSFWVHWGFLILYGVAMIFLGAYDLLLVNGGAKELLKSEFGDIKFEKIDLKGEGGERLIQRNKKESGQMLGIFAICVGACVLLLTSTLF